MRNVTGSVQLASIRQPSSPATRSWRRKSRSLASVARRGSNLVGGSPASPSTWVALMARRSLPSDRQPPLAARHPLDRADHHPREQHEHDRHQDQDQGLDVWAGCATKARGTRERQLAHRVQTDRERDGRDRERPDEPEPPHREVETRHEVHRLDQRLRDLPRLAAPHQEQTRETHPQSVQRGEGEQEHAAEQQPLADLEGDTEEARRDQQDRDRARRAHHQPADGHAEEHRHEIHRGREVELEVPLTLLPPQLRRHHPDDVQPERRHRPTDDREPDVRLRRMKRAIDEHERRRREERQQDLEEQPGLLTRHRAHPRVGASDQRVEVVHQDLARGPGRRLARIAAAGPREDRVHSGLAHRIGSASRVSTDPASDVAASTTVAVASPSAWPSRSPGRARGRSIASASSKPRPPSSTNTSSSVGSLLRKDRMWLPCPTIADTMPPSTPSSSSTRFSATVCASSSRSLAAPVAETTPGRRARAAWPPSRRSTSIRKIDSRWTRRLSSAGVPIARMRPWSTIATRSHSSSA